MLRVEGVKAGYGGLPVLQGVSIGVQRGESVAIIGANGAGKSTLVRAICGLLPVAAGNVLHEGVRLTAMPPHLRARQGIAVVLENRHLFGELTVRSNLELAAMHGKRRLATRLPSGHKRFSVADVVELFPFMRDRLQAPVALLSGGEQQMVAIARALLLHPDLLIMDEPSTGLSPKVVRTIVGVIERLREDGMSLLLVEQNVALAAQVSDRAYVMALGRVVHEVRQGEWERFRSDDVLLRAYLGEESKHAD